MINALSCCTTTQPSGAVNHEFTVALKITTVALAAILATSIIYFAWGCALAGCLYFTAFCGGVVATVIYHQASSSSHQTSSLPPPVHRFNSHEDSIKIFILSFLDETTLNNCRLTCGNTRELIDDNSKLRQVIHFHKIKKI